MGCFLILLNIKKSDFYPLQPAKLTYSYRYSAQSKHWGGLSITVKYYSCAC